MLLVRRSANTVTRLLSKPAALCCRLASTRTQRSSLSRSQWVAGGGAIALAGVLYAKQLYGQKSAACAEQQQPPHDQAAAAPGEVAKGLPDYSLEEISKHVTQEARIWVTYKDGVYDITEFARLHPGGDEKILLAKGGAIDPFWEVFSVHATRDTLDLLETMRIGNVAADDRAKRRATSPKDGPYANDPSRSPVLKVDSSEPFNAETPPPLLVDRYTTPKDLFFVRNHLPVPDVRLHEYALEVGGDGLVPIRLTLDDLKSKFQQHTVVSTIQCTGNRRSDLQAVKPIKGLPWSVGAIGTAEWTGVWLRDVLAHAGVKLEREGEGEGDISHVHLEGLDRNSATGECYGASVPVRKALDPHGDCLLAYAMNGEPLSRDHGYPLRAVVPGVAGARNVKWLSRVWASKTEYGGFWQQRDYKSFNPSVDWDNVDFSRAPAIQETPVQSAICSPLDGAAVPEGESHVTLKGYAYSGGGRGIIRVDVSADGGKTWQEAALEGGAHQDPYRAWAWVLWEAKVPLPATPGSAPRESGGDGSGPRGQQQQLEVCCRAVDRSYNTQPESPAPIWNLRGVLSNSWHRIHLKYPPPPPSPSPSPPPQPAVVENNQS